ncbi:bifunctional aspartate transaminase/aspartate 4-decarboxylase [Cellulomonas sp. NPDC089187]|uniref:bifunctional aspartate transaminase/aspartate 4-decarboxylase n=1 Tax=Cellulomonas sp. NPDC089187 TaxID=3154970 RepID=UPI003437B87A
MTVQHISRDEIRRLQQLSPFELKNTLSSLAGEHERRTAFQMLNAGRGNPNFTAPTPREAFFRLGMFAVEESRAQASWDPELVGVPQEKGIADRFRAWLDAHQGESGVDLLTRLLDWGTGEAGYDPDPFVWELADAAIGDHYPEPDRMLKHTEDVVRRYLYQELGEGMGSGGGVDLFAVEGGTAAMCYIFGSLKENRLMHAGDTVAIMTPIFTPYLEITELADFGFEQIHIQASAVGPDGGHTWQYPDEELDKLRDPSVKALFCVNPTNPPSVRMDDRTLERIADIVATDNPNLVIITDDVYSTFAPGFRSLAAVCPRNTITVYSFSKYFGATGWRLGVIATHRKTILDEQIAALPEADKVALDTRYESLSLDPRSLKFTDRLVADSRDVALNHTAGLSLPQQLQMLLFSAYCLLDTDQHYKQQAQALIQHRLDRLETGLGYRLPADANRVAYYIEIDFRSFAQREFGDELVAFLDQNYEPTDILFRLAEQTGIIALNGGGFDGPPWSIRFSLANLDDDQYEQIGKSTRAVALQYVDEFRAQGGTLPPVDPELDPTL